MCSPKRLALHRPTSQQGLQDGLLVCRRLLLFQRLTRRLIRDARFPFWVYRTTCCYVCLSGNPLGVGINHSGAPLPFVLKLLCVFYHSNAVLHPLKLLINACALRLPNLVCWAIIMQTIVWFFSTKLKIHRASTWKGSRLSTNGCIDRKSSLQPKGSRLCVDPTSRPGLVSSWSVNN